MPHGREGKVPKYRLHRNSRQAVVTLGGRDFYLGPWRSTASRVEYDRLIGEWLANGRRLPATTNEAADLTIVEIADRYLQFAEDYYVKNGQPTDTIYGIRRALAHLCQLYGEQNAEKFGPLSLLAIQNKMIADRKSRRYINDTTDRIRRIFKWAAARELVQVTVYQALQTVPGLRKGRTDAKEPAPVGPVSDDVVTATMSYMPPMIRAMVQFQRRTGCRPDEVCQLRPENLDREGRVWSYRPAHHKTEHLGRERVIFVGPQAQAVLTPYLDGPPDAPCFSPTQSEKARNGVRKMGRVFIDATTAMADHQPISVRSSSQRRRDVQAATGRLRDSGTEIFKKRYHSTPESDMQQIQGKLQKYVLRVPKTWKESASSEPPQEYLIRTPNAGALVIKAFSDELDLSDFAEKIRAADQADFEGKGQVTIERSGEQTINGSKFKTVLIAIRMNNGDKLNASYFVHSGRLGTLIVTAVAPVRDDTLEDQVILNEAIMSVRLLPP